MQSGSRVVKGRGGCYRGMMTSTGREHFVGQLEIEGFAPALSRAPGPGWVCSHWGLIVGLLSPSLQSDTPLETRPREPDLGPLDLLPPGRNSFPSLAVLDVPGPFVPPRLSSFSSSQARKCNIWARKQGGDGSVKQ